MKQKNILKIALFMLFAISTTFSLKAQTLTAGDLAIIGVSVDDEEILLVALADIPSGESVFFTDEEWNGTDAFLSGEGFYEWVTPAITAGNTITLTTAGSTAGGTVTQRAGSFALGNSGDGVFIYQTSTNVYNTGTYTILGFAGEDSGDSGDLTGTGLVEGTNAVYFGGDNGIYTGVRTTNDKSGHLANIYNSANWATSGTAQTFDTTNFVMTGAGPAIILGTVSGNTSEDEITTATFTAVLTVQPATDVVLNLSSGDLTEITLDVAELTFTTGNWNTPQTVTATGVDDVIQDGNIEVTITVSVDDANSDDDYDGISTSTTITNEDDELSALVINEILYDPNGDANGDGTLSATNDEFVELYNTSGAPLDISGYTLSDGALVRHTFPKGTILPTDGSIVVFAGGTISDFTNVGGLVQVAGSLGLSNSGDTVTIADASAVTVTSVTYDGSIGNNQSIARSPDFSGAFVEHSTIATNAVNFSPGRDNTDNIPFIKTWTGATDNVWATPTNWLGDSTPSLTTDNVIIPSGLTNYPTASSSVIVNSAIIESGSSLIAESTFNASLTVKRDLATTNWYLLGMPVMTETKTDMIANNNFAIGTGSNIGLSFYDNDLVSNQWTYATAATTGSFFDIGYSVKLASAGTITAIGSMRTTNVGISLTNGTATGFNLIGNVYPSYLAANSNADATNNLLTVNSAKLTETTLWFWNEGTDSYDQINQASNAFHVAPSQGFFVQVSSNQSFSYTEDMQSHQSTDSFQKSVNTRPEIKLFLSDGTLNRDADIYFIDGTTPDFDNGYDSSIFGGVSHSFAVYTELVSNNTGKKLGIQSLPNTDYENMVIPVGINAELGKEITISLEALNLPAGLKVFLEDRNNNTFTRLDEANTNYKVTLSENVNGTGRFYLHTKSSALSVDDVTMGGISIYKTTNSNLRIAGLSQGKSTVKLFNMLGKQVLNTSFTSNGVQDISIPNLATGIYIVTLETETGKLNRKITLE